MYDSHNISQYQYLNRLILRSMVNFMVKAGYSTDQFNTFIDLLTINTNSVARYNRLYTASEISLAFQLAIEVK